MAQVINHRAVVLSIVLGFVLGFVPAVCADDTGGVAAVSSSELKQLGSEVDVLQMISDLGLSRSQVVQLAAKVAQVNTKRLEYSRKEQQILEKIKTPLEQMKDALLNGKPVPATPKSLADAGLRELESLRKQGWADYDGYVASAVKILTAKQVRDVRRSPEALKRAGEMVRDVRFAPQDKYPQIREKLVAELLEVKKLDRRDEWFTIGQEKLAGLTGESREEAVNELQKLKDEETTRMKAEISGLLDSIRSADSRVLSVGVDKLASALRADVDVNAELTTMMSRILDAPTAEALLTARAEKMPETAAEEE